MIQAMILAAGRGERMRPLTDHLPKPLLCVGGKPLIVWHIERLASVGITDIVINLAWLGDQIQETLGNGDQFGVHIEYSQEPMGGLETAGGIANALPLLGDQPFLVINGDIFCDWNPMHAMNQVIAIEEGRHQAWLLLVDNPDHHPNGDFFLLKNGQVKPNATTTVPLAVDHPLTFSGIGVYSPSLFQHLAVHQSIPLAPLLRMAMASGLVYGEHFHGQWVDVGTPERFHALDKLLSNPA